MHTHTREKKEKEKQGVGGDIKLQQTEGSLPEARKCIEGNLCSDPLHHQAAAPSQPARLNLPILPAQAVSWSSCCTSLWSHCTCLAWRSHTKHESSKLLQKE